ncbi:MAG: hypothetical protein QF675_12580, partial [SAR324 cluster bacterium]|nr:hypothetical protein [SAR324 cluster bacterium]
KDSDFDGLPDQWETDNGYPLDSANELTEDEDGDGLATTVEWLLGSNPKSSDSDSDGVLDAEELRFGTDLEKADSKPFAHSLLFSGLGFDWDQNGKIDLLEVRTSPWNIGPKTDDDVDGFLNAFELSFGTDPFDSNSFPEILIGRTGQDVTVEWSQTPYSHLNFETSADLRHWDPLFGELVGSRNQYRFRLDETDTPLFFQQPLAWPITEDLSDDMDGDGISSLAEALAGLDNDDPNSSKEPLMVDTDANGEPDTTMDGDLYTLYSLLSGGLSAGKELSPQLASRFLMQSTFGPTLQDIEYLRKIGIEAWLEEQLYNLEPEFLSPKVMFLFRDAPPGGGGEFLRRNAQGKPEDIVFNPDNLRTGWA